MADGVERGEGEYLRAVSVVVDHLASTIVPGKLSCEALAYL